MTTLSATGFSRSRLDERLAALQASMQAIFGSNINLDPDSIDGQMLGIFAEAINNLDQLAEDVYHSLNPQSASGVALSRLVQLNGIKRIAGAYSSTVLHCGGQQGTVIPAGSLAKSPSTGVTFSTVDDATIGATGFVDVAAFATQLGALLAPTGSVTKIDTPIYGWQTVTNQADAVPGKLEEADEALRIRRRASTSTPALGVLDSLRGTLANTPGVLQVEVFENPLGITDSNGLPRNSVYCVVNGGLTQDIINAIWLKKPAGPTLVGSVTGTALDSAGNPHQINFSRPTPTDVFVVINLHKKSGWPTDGAARMQSALLAWALANQGIGKEVIQSRLFDPLNSVPGHSIDSLFIGTAANPTTSSNIVVPFDGLAMFDSTRIVVNVT